MNNFLRISQNSIELDDIISDLHDPDANLNLDSMGSPSETESVLSVTQ